METTEVTSAVKSARLAKGWTLRELADAVSAHVGADGKRTEVDYSALSKIENGIRSPRPGLRAALAAVLEIDALSIP